MDSQPSKTSKTSKVKRPTSGKTKTVIVPIIPQDVIDEILGHLAADSDFISLQSCALVSKSWVPACRRHLFHTIHFSSKDRARWLETFPVPEESPARYVRHLHITVKRSDSPLRMTSFGGLPQSVTSLTVIAIIAVLPKIQQIMVQLPNLDDLSLSGQITAMDQNMLFGIGSVLRGRFGGKLQLLGVHASPGVVDMLLEIPTGLRFTEVEIRSSHEYLFSIVRLVEACSKTLVKLSYAISSHRVGDRGGAFERSFDFSKFPNLQEVDLEVKWWTGDLLWIPAALSTLGSATSPHPSAVRLDFARSSSADQSVRKAFKATRDDLRRVADEVARIEREFKGTVNVTVVRDAGFKAILNKLDVFKDR